MNFVKYDQSVLMITKIEFGLRQFGAILFGFEIEVKRIMALTDFQRQRRLAHLTWAKQCHRRRMSDGIRKLNSKRSMNHPCNYGYLFRELQG